ncbi:MAG: hypothetical protein P4L57_13570 [Rhizomicrobium sp.]|nr:hypothetical protein [Rhizomicrobium sp.]
MKRTHPVKAIGLTTLIAASLVVAGLAMAPPAYANNDDDTAQAIGGILGALIGAAMIDKARKDWANVEPETRECLVRRYNISPGGLGNQGIGPRDNRVYDYVNSCAQMVAQARRAEQLRQEQEQAERDAALARERAEREEAAALERQRQMEAEAAEQKRLQEIAAIEAQRKAHHRALSEKYGERIGTAVEEHRIEVGMTRQALLESRGEPDHTPDRIPQQNMEMWIYGSTRIVLTDGRVSRIN